MTELTAEPTAQPTVPEIAPPHYAGFWIRLCAHLIDSTLLTIAAGLLQATLLGLMVWVWSTRGVVTQTDPVMVQVFGLGLYFCISFPYYVWGHYRYGCTLGKKPLNIRVVDFKTLGPITVKQSILRFFGYALSILFFGCGFLMVAIHPQKRALHELISGTASIRTR